ncbi:MULTISPECIES: PLP-dependent transferase [Halomonadaceae]|jgi:cystathionine gamma-synthase|uniref:PLP-dependent transferase n=1 Tax=Halomonadaceae TaxID=28256 RepID=UPI0018D1F8FB|nr:PLP-dependent transferase [Halomonas sp. SS10-MC5]
MPESTLYALEETLAALEDAEAAWSFSSGMRAISDLLLTHGQRGIVCLGEVYGGTLPGALTATSAGYSSLITC